MTLLHVNAKATPERVLGSRGGKLCAYFLSIPNLYSLCSALIHMMRPLYSAKDAETGNQRTSPRLCLSPFRSLY